MVNPPQVSDGFSNLNLDESLVATEDLSNVITQTDRFGNPIQQSSSKVIDFSLICPLILFLGSPHEEKFTREIILLLFVEFAKLQF